MPFEPLPPLDDLVEMLALRLAQKYHIRAGSVEVKDEEGKTRFAWSVSEIVRSVAYPFQPQHYDSHLRQPPSSETEKAKEETTPPKPQPQSEFEPTDFQAKILAALQYKALKAEDLAGAIGCDRRSLWKRNGIMELKEVGWVNIDESDLQLGYYRPDMPPKELRQKCAAATDG